MGSVTLVPCRSYSTRTFDGCPACVDAALDAIGQAGLYVVGRSGPDLMGSPEGHLAIAFRLKLRLLDEAGQLLASDELEAEQSIELAAPADDFADPSSEGSDVDEAEPADHYGASMRLEDFQTVFDELRLAPAGKDGVAGFAAGHLYGFERSIGKFEIEVCPTH